LGIDGNFEMTATGRSAKCAATKGGLFCANCDHLIGDLIEGPFSKKMEIRELMETSRSFFFGAALHSFKQMYFAAQVDGSDQSHVNRITFLKYLDVLRLHLLVALGCTLQEGLPPLFLQITEIPSGIKFKDFTLLNEDGISKYLSSSIREFISSSSGAFITDNACPSILVSYFGLVQCFSFEHERNFWRRPEKVPNKAVMELRSGNFKCDFCGLEEPSLSRMYPNVR
jgi:hypothetical protein